MRPLLRDRRATLAATVCVAATSLLAARPADAQLITTMIGSAQSNCTLAWFMEQVPALNAACCSNGARRAGSSQSGRRIVQRLWCTRGVTGQAVPRYVKLYCE